MINLLEGSSHARVLDSFSQSDNTYFLPDRVDKSLYRDFCEKNKIECKFPKNHQGKEPDIVLKRKGEIFFIEAKHIKESGGAQDKQVAELIEFIKYSERQSNFHYLSFMDGTYFNKFISIIRRKDKDGKKNRVDNKTEKQKYDIEKYLIKNKNNFFVNTAGFKLLLKDI